MKLKYRYNKAEFEEQLMEDADLNSRIIINLNSLNSKI